jgi:hypothetical protein
MSTKKKNIAEDIERGGDILTAPETPAFDAIAAAIAERNAGRRVLHVNGQPVPQHLEHLIGYDVTDEGIAEKNAGRAESSGVRVTGDAWDKALARGADPSTPMEIWEDENPLAAAVTRATGGQPNGFAHKLLSDRVIQRKGMRKYEIAKDPVTHEPIRVANMVLGRMPETLKDKRNRYYQRESERLLDSVEQNYATDQDKSIRAAGSEGVSVLRSGEGLRDHRDPDRVIESTGVRFTRGL